MSNDFEKVSGGWVDSGNIRSPEEKVNLDRPIKKSPLLATEIKCTVGMVAFAGVAMLFLPRELSSKYAAEGHLIENLSVAFLAIALCVAGIQLGRKINLAWLSGVVLLLWACLREIDFQKKFTFRSVESIGYYTAAHVSVLEKLIVLLVLLPFAAAAAYLAWFVWSRMKKRRLTDLGWAGYPIAIAFLAGLAQVCEKLVGEAGEAIEELSELGIAVILLLLVLNRVGGKSDRLVQIRSAEAPVNHPYSVADNPLNNVGSAREH